MGHHTKKHRKRTSRRGKYQKISPKKTRRRRQTKRRGGACCGSKASESKSKRKRKSKGSKSRAPRPSGTSGKGSEISVAIMYGDSTGHPGTQDVFFRLSKDKKLAFCHEVLEEKIFAKNAGGGVEGLTQKKLESDIERIGMLIKHLEKL